MGDPSLTAYLGVPQANSVTLPGSIDPLDSQVSVTAVPKSYVGITQNGVLLGSALVGPSGSALVYITPPLNKGNVHVVVTAQNRIPYITDIPVAATEDNCLLVSADTLSFGGVVQGIQPSRSVNLWNVCPSSQNWTVTQKPDWLSADPDSGSLTPSPAMRTVFFTPDVSGLGVGTSHTGLVQFESEGGICSLYVSVDVRSAALLAAPVIRSPKDSVEVSTLTPTLVVENAAAKGAALGAAKGAEDLWVYFEIDTSLSFSSPNAKLSDAVTEGDSTAEWQPAELIENTVWFWRAWRADSYAAGDTSDVAVFIVNATNECPDPVALTAPAADSVLLDRRPVFEWTSTTDPDPAGAISYRLFVQGGGEWDSLYAGHAGADTVVQWPDSLADNTAYRWKVAADDEDGCRAWSVTWAFSVNLGNDAPGPFALVSPDSGGVSSTLRPTFQWSAAEDPDPGDNVSYWIWFSRDSLFQDVDKGDSVYYTGLAFRIRYGATGLYLCDVPEPGS